MPTLTKTTTNPEVKALLRDLNKPSLHALSYALRHPETWPADFVWSYTYCDQCAMGLAHVLWKSIPEVDSEDGASVMARSFAMPFGVAENIFLGKGDWIPTYTTETGMLWWKEQHSRQNHNSVTPEMVADQIDAYLATAE